MIKCIKYSTSGTFDKAWRKGNWLLLNSNYEGGPTSNTGFFNHIEPPEGGYTLYLYKESGGPSIFVFNNNTELFDFCNNNLGASQTNIIGTLDWIDTQDDYFVDPTYFEFGVNTNDSGVSDFNQFKLPLLSNGSIDFVVDWGDGSQDTITTYNQTETLHTYVESGSYNIKIAGILRGWSFNNGGDCLKFITPKRWGCFNLTNTSAFRGCRWFFIEEGRLLDVPRISGTSIFSTFNSCLLLADTEQRQQGFGGWDVSNVQNFNNMFTGVEYGGFSNFDLEYWNMSSAVFVSNMFSRCYSFNAPIGNWNVSNVSNMLAMFNFCTAFDQPIGKWDTSQVMTMSRMFWGANTFNQDISNWNTSMVTDMSFMFREAVSFNQDIGNWNTSAVNNMREMFRYANSFNQDISNWNISSVTNFTNFLDGAPSFSTENLDKIYINWSQQNVTPFISISFGFTQYSSAGAAGRQALIDKGWTITDGGLLS